MLILFLVFNSLTLFGQKISGRVLNASTHEAIADASISLMVSGKPVNGALSDSGGRFTLRSVPPGTNVLSVAFVGYKTLTLSVSEPRSLGVLYLTPEVTYMKDVTITGARPLVENHIDKMVYNVANDLTSQNGVALDVLKKVPSVSVDVDGNVELEGDANIRFLINGKPSTIFGASLTDALQSIPASQIKSIEVITSPGAKYDASGTGGIINIVLKESRVQGIHSSVNLSAGTRLENGSFNLNARKNNLGLNAFFNGRAQLNSTTLTLNDRQSFNPSMDSIVGLIQQGSTAFRRSGYEGGLTAQWDVSPKDKLEASFHLDHFGNHGTSLVDQTSAFSYAPSSSSVLNSGSQFHDDTYDYSLDYKKTFARKDQELDALVTTSSGRDLSNYFQSVDTTLGGISGSRGYNPGTDRETDASIDYTQPISGDFTLETGVKGVFETLSNIVNTDTLAAAKLYIPDSGQTYGFTYRRQIYAAYASMSFSAFRSFLEGKAGLRYEYTHTTADYPGAVIPGYGIFAPSVVLTHHFGDVQSLKVAYTYRIERPDYGDLNPFYNISDPHNISTGNPVLKPEVGHRFEIGYNRNFSGGGSLYFAAIYRYNTDDIQTFSTYYSSLTVDGVSYSDVALSQRFNLGKETDYGTSIFASVPITPSLNVRSNILLVNRISQTPGLPNTVGLMFRGNLNVSYSFGHDLVAEVFGNYNSRMTTIQGYRPAFAYYTVAARKQFWHKKASVGLTATNPFNEYVLQRALTSGTGFTQTTIRQVPYRSFGVTLMYTFGKLEFKEKPAESPSEPAAPVGDQGQ